MANTWTPFAGGPVYTNGQAGFGNSSGSSGTSLRNSGSNAVSVTANNVANNLDRLLGIQQANNAYSATQASQLREWQEKQNATAMAFNRNEAAKNRQWQEYMSNTAHQREVKDLKAAGLNPVLSAMGGNGAAVTSGATASGVTSSGAMGQMDTSTSGAIANLLGSFLNAQTQLQAMNTSAITNLAVADKYTAMQELVANIQRDTTLTSTMMYNNTALTTANISAAAQKYVSDNNLTGQLANAAAQRISATIHAEAQKYSANVSASASRYGSAMNRITQNEVANINAAVNKELKDMGIKAQFDFAEEFPSNAYQANPGQANVRDWIESLTTGFRDLGIGVGNFASLIPGKSSNPIGFFVD